MSSSPSFLDPIVVSLLAGQSILDVGCGYGRWASLIHSNYWEAGYREPPVVDGIDAFEPNVEYCARLPFYREVHQHLLPTPLTGRWDTVMACEVIEHIEQDQVFDALGVLEAAARRRVIITTPNWPALRGGSDTKLGFNEYEAHLSYVSRSDFRARGYQLVGAGFGHPEHWIDRNIQRLRQLRRAGTASAATPSDQPGEGPAVNAGYGQGQVSPTRRRLQEMRAALGGVSRLWPSFGHTVVAFKDLG